MLSTDSLHDVDCCAIAHPLSKRSVIIGVCALNALPWEAKGRVSPSTRIHSAFNGWGVHLKILIAAGVSGDEGIDLINGVAQFVVGIAGRELELHNQSVHLQPPHTWSAIMQACHTMCPQSAMQSHREDCKGWMHDGRCKIS